MGVLGLTLPSHIKGEALAPLVSELQIAAANASADLGGHVSLNA